MDAEQVAAYLAQIAKQSEALKDMPKRMNQSIKNRDVIHQTYKEMVEFATKAEAYRKREELEWKDLELDLGVDHNYMLACRKLRDFPLLQELAEKNELSHRMINRWPLSATQEDRYNIWQRESVAIARPKG